MGAPAPSPIKVRPYALSDLPRVLMIEQRSFPPGEAYGKQQFEEFHKQASEGFLVAEVDGDVVGYVMVHARAGRGEIISVAVEPSSRGLGIGRLLIGRAITHLEDLGIDACYLETRTTNRGALRLFETYGFQLLGEIKDYYGPGSHAYRLRLDLRTKSRRP